MSNNLDKRTGSTAGHLPAGANDAQETLRRLDRLANIGLISASLAHEIKNGLVAIKAFVDVLAEKSREDDMAQMVAREMKRIDALATQMMRHAAPRPPSTARVRVNELLEHSLKLLDHQMAGRSISLQRNYTADSAAVRGDESQLQQALMNLLLNAVESMGHNGQLTVTTEICAECSVGKGLKISITDTGVGISPENQLKLFEPFFTTKKQGTGLGLAICRSVIHEHKGTIEVKSEPGRGSTFILLLPVE